MCAEDEPLPPPGIVRRIKGTLRLAAKDFALTEERYSRHPLRSGWTTSLFAPGVPLGGIRRLGRWLTMAIREYLRFDYPHYFYLGDLSSCSSGLTDQLRLEEESSDKPIFAETAPPTR